MIPVQQNGSASANLSGLHNNSSSLSNHSHVDLSGMDMDCSPTSPGAASDLSEIFEPPKTLAGSAKKKKFASSKGK